jgi:hypothetical protein
MSNRRFKKNLSLLLCLLFLPAPAAFGQTAAPPSEQLRGLDAYIERGLGDWEIPGLAIAVVKDD